MNQVTNSRYQVKSLLGEGGMGRVSLAYDRIAEREVALKEILVAGADAAEFKQEFWWMSRLEHPNLVAVYDFGVDAAARPYFTMEVVPGTGLDAELPLAEGTVRDVLRQLCRALRHIHRQGLVHGDIKPENLRLLPDGTLKLMDFGLMARAGVPTGVRGTPAYMAPEVIQQAPVDQRADLYALGVLTYQLLTGRLPFLRETTSELLRAHLEDSPLPMGRHAKGLDASWQPFVSRLLAKEPIKRFQSASEVLEALGETVEDESGVLFTAPFIGRENELERFEAALAALDERRGLEAFAVSGPEGAGKSRLLDEFALRAQLAERPIGRGNASGQGAVPYGPFIGLLRQLWGAFERLAPDTLEAHGGALAGLLPDLAPPQAGPRLEPQQEKLRLQSAVSELLLALAARNGLVLLLDDWHRADALSVELLAVLARRLAGAPVLVATAGQPGQPGEHEAALPATPLALGPLARQEVSEFLGAMLGVERVPYPFVNQFAELTGSSPAGLAAFVGHVVHQGLLGREKGRWVLQPLPPEKLPASWQDVLAERLGALSPLGRRVIELAAILEADFPLSLLLRLLPDVEPEALYETLADLEAAQLLQHGPSGYHAPQAHLLEALRHGLEPAAARALHTRVAEALEEAEGDETGEYSDALLVRLAQHFLVGDRPNKAILYALKAATATAALHDNAASRSLLERGQAVLDGCAELEPGASAAIQADYWLLSGDLHRKAGASAEAERCYVDCLALEATRERPGVHMRALVGAGLLQQQLTRYEEAVEHFEAALALAPLQPDAREELRGLAALGRTHYLAGDVARSQAVCERALGRAREAGDAASTGEALSFLGWLHVSTEPAEGEPSRVTEGLEYLNEAIELKEALGDKLGLNDAYMLLGNAQLAMGALRGAAHAFARNQALCAEIGASDEEAIAHLNLGLVAGERGDHLGALEHLHKAREVASKLDAPFALGLAECLEAKSLLAIGQLASPAALLEGSLAAARADEHRYWELFALVYGVDGQIKLGRIEAAQEAMLEALALEAETGIAEYALPLQLSKAALALKQGELEPAEAAYREALARAVAKDAHLIEAKAKLGLAHVAVARADWHEAGRWAQHALDDAEGCDAQGLVTEGHYLKGLIALGLHVGHEADRHFARAQEAAERLNLLDLLARALFQRAALQFPAPQAGKLKKRAQEIMIQQVDGLEPDAQERFLAHEGRYAVFMGDLSAASAVPEPATDADDETAALMTQQRLWIEELQGACSLLMKQLELSQQLSRSTDQAFVLAQALALVLEVTQTERGEVLMLEGKRLVSRAKKQLSSLQRIDEDWSHYTDAIERVLESGEVLYLADTSEIEGRLGLEAPRSVLVLPLSDESGRLGVMLVLGHPEEAGGLTKREVDAVKVLANQLAASLRNIRMQAEWREKTARLEMLYQLSSSVTSTLVMEEVLDLVIKLSLEITQADRGFLFLVDDEGELECKAARHPDGPIANFAAGEAYSQSICRRVLESGEPLCVEDTRDDELLKHQKSILDLNLRTVMCVPLRVKQKCFGVLYVDSRVVVNTFTDRDLELLKSIASHASIALENARLYKLATVDGLTGLYFRSHFEQRMKEEMQRAARFGSPLCYMMMDIDHFKKFNDTYGHAVGDEVLRHVAGIIKNGVRQEIDIPCRYGGEEMVVLLPETDATGAAIFAERIRKAIDESLLDTEEFKGLHVTISIGVACYPHHAATSLELMELADQALYASKRGGRNRVTVYSKDLGAGQP